MGRGRAKAKQAKVARQLKYNAPEMDLESLQKELSGHGSPYGHGSYGSQSDYSDVADEDDDQYVDPYADLYDDEGNEISPDHQSGRK